MMLVMLNTKVAKNPRYGRPVSRLLLHRTMMMVPTRLAGIERLAGPSQVQIDLGRVPCDTKI